MDWSNKCFLCDKEMEERFYVKTLVEIERKVPDYAEPFFTHYYYVCKECYEKKELV